MDNSPKELHINPAFEEDDKPTSMESVQLKAFPIQTEGESGHSNDGHCNQYEALNFEKAKPVQRSNRARLVLVIIVCLIFLVALLLTLLMLVGKTGSSNEDINDCESHPCKNNGICTDRVNGFNCSCAPGFYGPQCETDINDCASHPCKNNGICTDRVNGFNCSCAPGFYGPQCETDINDCESHPCKNNGICTDRVNGFNCSCAPGFYGPQCETDVPASSCKELYDKHKLRVNKAYVLHTDSGKIPVYCHMTSYGIGACGRGGWTLVMKTDGNKSTFHYNSPLWTNKSEFNLPGGKTGFDFQETKLPTYWNTPFSKICLGMKIGHQIKFLVINRHANSLYSLIADGKYRATSLGRNTWKTLIGSQASLQRNCNREGLNAVGDRSHQSKARIGILGNNQNDCSSCDSRIGFGTGGYHDDSNTCGNQATHFSDNGDKHIKAMGYILVQ